jgi:hypothetical protein
MNRRAHFIGLLLFALPSLAQTIRQCTLTYHVSHPLHKSEGVSFRITGTIPATLSDFKVDPPSLLAIPVKNEIPVRVEMTWHAEQ